MDGLAGLWVDWLVCGWFVGSLDGLCGFWLVCGWFVGSLRDLWVVWVVSGWFDWFVGAFEIYN